MCPCERLWSLQIVRLPLKESEKTEAVYCDLDGSDRFCVALLHNDIHIYPPRHYLTVFDETKAAGLKCMKAKTNVLTPWDRQKRRAIQEVLAWKKGTHKIRKIYPPITASHSFPVLSLSLTTICDRAKGMPFA